MPFELIVSSVFVYFVIGALTAVTGPYYESNDVTSSKFLFWPIWWVGGIYKALKNSLDAFRD